MRSELNQILTPQEYFISHIECAECAWIAQRAGDTNWFDIFYLLFLISKY